MNLTRFGTMAAALCVAGLGVLQAAETPQAARAAVRPPITTAAAIAHYTAKAPLDADPAGAAKIDILIERWSTDKERDDLSSALAAGGPDGMLSALQSIRRRAGVLLMPGVQNAGARARLRRPLNVYFAQKVETPGGTQVVLVTDHYLAFGQPTVDWPSAFEISMLDIRFAGETGVGKVAPATKLTYNTTTARFEVANYDAEPARLLAVRSEKP